MDIKTELYPKIREVKETSNFAEVNALVSQNWILLGVVPSQPMKFHLGRLE